MSAGGGRPVEGMPPWILGQRGLPLEAPENTLASFQRALDVRADGLHYDLRIGARGEPVVMRDGNCLRTAEVDRELHELSMPELSGLDVGGWFSKDFVGEPIPHLDEVLMMEDSYGQAPMHFIELHAGELVGELRRTLSALPHALSLRVGSVRRDICLELRDAGLASVLIVDQANKQDLAFARDERLSAVAVTRPRGWELVDEEVSWPFERWALGVESSDDLYECMRQGLNAISTSELHRAQSIRELLRLSRVDQESFPLKVSELPIPNFSGDGHGGEWRGDWRPRVVLQNPLPFAVRVRLEMFVRRGAFEAEDLPVHLELQPGEEQRLQFQLRGGSWSPGGDPLLAAMFEWERGPGREAGHLLLDQTMRRTRQVDADGLAQRVEMLREKPGQSRATMTVVRRADSMILRVENPGGLQDLRAIARLDGQTWSAGAALRIPLPRGFDQLAPGVTFTCGFWGQDPASGTQVLRRWCGGLPAEPRSGEAGWLVPLRKG
jgi:hypothetical protein